MKQKYVCIKILMYICYVSERPETECQVFLAFSFCYVYLKLNDHKWHNKRLWKAIRKPTSFENQRYYNPSMTTVRGKGKKIKSWFEHLNKHYSKVVLFLRMYLMSTEAKNYKDMGQYRAEVSYIKVILISSIKYSQ